VGFGETVFVGVGVGVAVCVGVAVAGTVGVAAAAALETKDGSADACPAAIGSSSRPVAIMVAPVNAHSRATRDMRLDRELKVFLGEGSG